jgi:hypothetical protein
VSAVSAPGADFVPGAKKGPRHFSWFKTVVTDYFSQKRDRELVTGNGNGGVPWTALSREELVSMTEVLE